MAFNWAYPNPLDPNKPSLIGGKLRNVIGTFAVYLFEIQDAVNTLRQDIGEPVITWGASNYLYATRGDTLTLEHIDIIRDKIDTLIQLYKYNSVVDILGRNWAQYQQRIDGKWYAKWQIIQDFRDVLDFLSPGLECFSTEDISTIGINFDLNSESLQTDTKQGNLAEWTLEYYPVNESTVTVKTYEEIFYDPEFIGVYETYEVSDKSYLSHSFINKGECKNSYIRFEGTGLAITNNKTTVSTRWQWVWIPEYGIGELVKFPVYEHRLWARGRGSVQGFTLESQKDLRLSFTENDKIFVELDAGGTIGSVTNGVDISYAHYLARITFFMYSGNASIRFNIYVSSDDSEDYDSFYFSGLDDINIRKQWGTVNEAFDFYPELKKYKPELFWETGESEDPELVGQPKYPIFCKGIDIVMNGAIASLGGDWFWVERTYPGAPPIQEPIGRTSQAIAGDYWFELNKIAISHNV